jgi:LysR family transcriptional regulator, hydrogen peroxide-inducible genes activator
LRAEYVGTSLDSLREMVATGLGLALLPALFVRTALERDPLVKALPLDGAPLERRVGLVWRASSSSADSFLQLAASLTDIIAQEFGDLPKLG